MPPPYTVTLTGFRPIRRHPPNDQPFTEVDIQESPDAIAWVTLETQQLVPVDADAAEPAFRNLTLDTAQLERAYYRVVWRVGAPGGPTSTSGAVYNDAAGGGYPSLADLLEDASDELAGLTASAQAMLRAEAIAGVERYCGQRFLPRVGTLIVDGTGASELYLPERVEALTGVLVKGSDLDLSQVEVSEDGARLHFAAVGTGYYEQAMQSVAGRDSRTFRAGAGTVILTGTFGWATLPAEVERAIRVEMEEQAAADASALSGIVSSARRLGLKNVSQGNLRADIGDPSMLAPRAAALLSGYVWHGLGGYLL